MEYNDEIFKAIVDRFGEEVQINKIQEECLELALSINQLECPTKDKWKMEVNLYDELADVFIMVKQFPHLFDMVRLNAAIHFKLHKVQNKYLSGK